MMAGVANSMNASTPKKASSGQMFPSDSSDSVVLSPGIKEAMDRIFPKSAAQFLQRGLSFDDDAFLGMNAVKENMHPTVPPSSLVENISLPSTMSTANGTTTITTNTAVSGSGDVVTLASGSGLPFVSYRHFVPPSSPQAISPAANSSNKSANVESKDIPIDLSRATVTKINISKDHEISSSPTTFDDESCEKVSKKANSTDLSSCDYHSNDDSDSEDMRRPFASVSREKKKHKKKKKKNFESNMDMSDSSLSEYNVNSGKKYNVSKMTSNASDSSNHPHSDNLSLPDSIPSNKQSTIIYKPDSYEVKKNTELDLNDQNSHYQSCIFENGSLTKDTFYKDCELTSEEVSNISYSSTKENIHLERRESNQQDPKTKHIRFNIVKHKKQIKNTFPPCFVVAKKINAPYVYNVMKDSHMLDNVLPLPIRVKGLLDLCNKGSIDCRKNRKMTVTEKQVYRNIFEETILLGASEDEFENARGRRGLRKRDKHISYVEPSEDDILDEYSRKRSRKHKDLVDDEAGSGKKKRKQDNLTAVTSDKELQSSNKDPPIITDIHTEKNDKSKKCKQKDKAKVPGKDIKSTGSGPKEIIVYPPASFSDSVTHKFRIEGREKFISSKAEHSKSMSSHEKDKNNITVLPSSTHISVLSTNSGTFTHHSNPVALFPPIPLGFPAGMTTQSIPHAATLPAPSSTSSAGQKPQYCVVKMDGTDVLLQLVPSSGIGLPVPMVVPKGKTLYVPPMPPLVPGPSHLFGHPLQHTLPMSGPTQAIPTPITSCVTAPQENAASASLQPMFGIPVLNRPMNTACQNIALSTLPVLPNTQLTGLANRVNSRPINFTAAGLARPINCLTTTANARPMNLSALDITNRAGMIPISISTMGLTNTNNIRPINLSAMGLASAASSRPINLSPASLTNTVGSGTISRLPGGLTNTASMRPINLTSVGTTNILNVGLSTSATESTYSSRNSSAELSAPLTEISSASPVMSVMSSTLSTQVSVAGLTTMAAPNSTTVVRSVHLPGRDIPSAAPNQSTSVRSVRIFVPGCSATGTQGHFATLGCVSNSSPLTRLTASSDLLPQRKSSSDQLSPEQRAAKRRKLEKKYPLPPGVVIKTEPLDSPPKPPTIITAVCGPRSLLSQNLRMFSPRSGAGVQTIRIIGSSLTGALTARNVGTNSNIIYRAASVGGGQTVLVPTSLEQISTKTTTAIASTSVTTCPVSSISSTQETAAISVTATTTATSCGSSSSSAAISLSSVSSDPLGNLTPPALAAPGTTGSNSNLPTSPSDNMSEQLVPHTTSDTTLCESSGRTNGVVTSAVMSLQNICVPVSYSRTTGVTTLGSSSDQGQPTTKELSDSTTQEGVRINIEQLKSIIQIQEARGLKGERLEKLREVLRKKEEYYKELQELANVNAPSLSASEFGGDTIGSAGLGEYAPPIDGQGSSETDPFVID